MSNPFGGSFSDPGVNPFGPAAAGYAASMAGGGSSSRSGSVDLNADVSSYQAAMNSAAASTQAVSTSVVTLSGHVDNLFKAGGRSLKILGAADVATLGAGVASLAALNNELSTMRGQAAVVQRSMGPVGNAIDSAFANLPEHRDNIVAIVQAISQLSVAQQDLQGLTNTAIKLQAITGDSSLGANLIQFARQNGSTSSDRVRGLANSLVVSSVQAGVSPTNVVNFGQSIAPISRQAGVTAPQQIGIAAAFSKAGADGFVAANTYNSILNDINTATRTGSPDLIKYATLLGTTADKFRRLPPAEQITRVFEAAGKGGPRSLEFVNELGLGIRGLSNFQAVAQSGGLRGSIATAVANQSGGAALDRGANAAFSGLDSQLTRFHNSMTRIVDVLAGPFMGAITGTMRGLADIAGAAAGLLKSLGPLPGMFGAVLGVLAPLAGIALGHAGLVGGLALARVMLSPNSGPRLAYAAGRASNVPGVGTEAARASNEFGQRLVAGTLPLRASLPYRIGERLGPRGEVLPTDGPGMARMGLFGMIRGVGSGLRGYINMSSRVLDDSTKVGLDRSAYDPSVPWGQRFGAFTAGVRSDAEGSAAAAAARQGLGIGGSLLRWGGSTLGAAGSMAMSGLGRIGSMAGLLGRAAFSPYGMLALGVGLPLASEGIHAFTSRQQASNQDAVQGALNPLQRYNDALGIATSKLADFSTSVTAAASAAAGQASTAQTFGQARQVHQSDIAQFFGKGSSDKVVAALAQSNPGNVGAAISVMQSYGISDPRQLDLFKQNLLGAGYSADQTQRILKAYHPNAAVNYRGLAGAINAANTSGAFSQNPSSNSSQIVAAALTSLSVGKQQDLLTRSPAYATTKYFRNTLGFLAAQGAGAGTAESRQGAFYNALATLTGGSSNDFSRAAQKMGRGSGNETWTIDANASPAEQQKQVITLLQSTTEGKKFLAGITGVHGATIDPAQFHRVLSASQRQTSDQQNAVTRQYGSLGRFATTDPGVLQAIGTKSGDAGVVQSAVVRLSREADTTSGGLGAASARLMRLSDTLGGATTASGQLAASAAGWARSLQAYQLPYMSRAGQLATLAHDAAGSAAAAAAPHPSDATIKQAKADEDALKASEQSYTSYMQEVERSAISFRTSMVRGAQDYHLQVFRSERDFNIQMEQSAEDYQRTVYRSERNFHIQMVQSEQDYTRQRARTLQDFNISQARSAQAAAESIYDPFQQVQVQQVVNGGMLEGNLQDQNRRIEQQAQQVKQLRQAGLSQAAIDTLQLDNPQNAQQTNSIAQSVINDPKTIARINKLIGERQAATTALTQSTYNEQFRNTVADFERGLHRTEQDFQISQARAQQQQHIALSDMAIDYETMTSRAQQAQNRTLNDMSTDYHTMVTRTTEDLRTSMVELYGTFQQQYDKTLEKINKDIGKYAPELAKTLTKEIKAAEKAVYSATNPSGGGTSGGTPGAGSSGSKNDPIYTAGTLGVNAGGHVGTYDKSGHWHEYKGYLSPSQTKALPHIGNPKKSPAAGGNLHGATSEQRYAENQLSKYGWNGDELAPLISLWNQESGWRPTARNPSGAFGIAQALGHGKPGQGAWSQTDQGRLFVDEYPNKAANSGNAQAQIDWGLKYIKDAYGSPSSAWGGYYPRGGWYASGSIFKGAQQIGVGEGGPEMVLPLDQRGASFMTGFYDLVSQALAARMHTMGRGMRSSGPPSRADEAMMRVHEDHRTVYAGDIHIEASDVATMERTLAERHRLRSLAQPQLARTSA